MLSRGNREIMQIKLYDFSNALLPLSPAFLSNMHMKLEK